MWKASGVWGGKTNNRYEIGVWRGVGPVKARSDSLYDSDGYQLLVVGEGLPEYLFISLFIIDTWNGGTDLTAKHMMDID